MAENARLMARLEALNQASSAVSVVQPVQQLIEEPTIEQEPLQLSNLQSLQLIKPEPQHIDQQSPLYMEFSPSAKPSNASLDNIQPALNALLNLNALQAALNQATSTALNPVVTNPMTSIDSTAAALLNVLANNNIGALPALNATAPNVLPFRNIDLINDGLIPNVPLLYPYNTNAC